MDYWKYSLRTDSETAEILLAYLSEAPFDTFEEMDWGLDAYLPAPPPTPPPTGRGVSPLEMSSLVRGQAPLPPGGGVGGGAASGEGPESVEILLNDLKTQFPFTWTKTFLPAQNWNAVWESNFQPVIVEDFCAVRADFHEPIPGVQHELVINPKMAFGTGHHETTWMCLRAMRELPCQGAHLLDFGCGTGVLAILAARLGAAEIEALDIEDESYQNTLENAVHNGVAEQIIARCGTLEAVQGRDFDGVLANINRNVILEALPRLAELLKSSGWLLVSGILEQDGPMVRDAATQAGFDCQLQEQRGNWLCLRFLLNR